MRRLTYQWHLHMCVCVKYYVRSAYYVNQYARAAINAVALPLCPPHSPIITFIALFNMLLSHDVELLSQQLPDCLRYLSQPFGGFMAIMIYCANKMW